MSPWKLFFDGSKTEFVVSIGFVIGSLEKIKIGNVFRLASLDCNNNQVEYKVIIMGLETLLDLKASSMEAYGDS